MYVSVFSYVPFYIFGIAQDLCKSDFAVFVNTAEVLSMYFILIFPFET